MRRIIEQFIEFCKNRLFIFLFGVTALFVVISVRLFSLQIIEGEEYQQDLTASIMRELTIPASRGNIYDRYGRPLATNEVAYSIKIDDSIKTELLNENLLLQELVTSLENNGQPVADDLPISSGPSYTFLFQGNQEAERSWKESIGLEKNQLDYSAEETYQYLLEKFEVNQTLSPEIQRKILSLGTKIDDKNLMLAYLVVLLEQNQETLQDDLPISQTQPYIFLFDDNESQEISWKKNSISMDEDQLGYTAEETMDYLIELFDIPDNLPESLKRNLVSIRYSLYLQRYRKFQPVTVALDISAKTMAEIEEKQAWFPGITIDTDSLRNYPAGKYMSHIIGYIRKVSDTDYDKWKEYGYTTSDIVGKVGIEEVKELDLNGEDGEMLVEVDSLGRRINTIETKQPISGDDVYLTIDEHLQKTAYDALEKELAQVLIKKLTTTSLRENPISLKQLFISMVNSNNISIPSLSVATEGAQQQVFQTILDEKPDYTITEDTAEENIYPYAKQIITEKIETDEITLTQMVLILYEQGIVTADEAYLDGIRNGTITPLSAIIQELESGELKPSSTNLDPCTGSVVVTDVNTGEVLALVSYPSYDNNRLVNNFDNAYYNSLLNDPTTPLVNRAITQKKAPGSTLKMAVAIAGLESGAITTEDTIQDLGSFTKTGVPYARCWIYTSSGSTHGAVNVSEALEVSCNYFFYETAYRMGNAEEGNSMESITTLNEYMAAFGLNDYSGIELGEYPPNMASPQYKEEVIKWQNPEATTSQTRWVDGDTIRAAIGQSVNNFAPSHMNKYIATLANGGTRYTMHLLNKVVASDGSVTEEITPTIENILEIKDENLEAVHEGMYLVTHGDRGTLRSLFRDFPINVAAKSGTAQENLNKSSHTWFVGFAPYENPQIAITVMIPFGEDSLSPAAVVAKEIFAEYFGLNYVPENTYMENTLAK